MRIVTWNIARLGGLEQVVERYGSLLKFLDALKIDILCVQETKVSNERLVNKDPQVKPLAVLEGFESFWSCSRALGTRSGHAGVATFVREKWSPIDAVTRDLFNDKELDDEGRVVMTDHGSFVLLNVYVPNAGEAPARERLPQKMRFLNLIRSYSERMKARGKNVIIAGDINISRTQDDVYAERARVPYLGYSEEELAFMDAFVYNVEPPTLENNGERTTSSSSSLFIQSSQSNMSVGGAGGSLVDVWRSCHKGVKHAFSVWDWYTKARERNTGARIDYILLDTDFYKRFADPSLTAHLSSLSATSSSSSSSPLSSLPSSSSSSTTTTFLLPSSSTSSAVATPTSFTAAATAAAPPPSSSSSATSATATSSDVSQTSPRPFKIAEITLNELASLPTFINSAFYLDTPVEWSDHIPLVVTMLDPPLPPPHGPCSESSKRVKHFAPDGKNIMSMFKNQAALLSTTSKISGPNTSVNRSHSDPGGRGTEVEGIKLLETSSSSTSSSSSSSSLSATSIPASLPLSRPSSAPALTTKAASTSGGGKKSISSSSLSTKVDKTSLLSHFFAPKSSTLKRDLPVDEEKDGKADEEEDMKKVKKEKIDSALSGQPKTSASPTRGGLSAKKSKSRDTVCG